MRHVAKVICNESGFLVEEELRKLLEPLVETERNLVNLDALLKVNEKRLNLMWCKMMRL